MTGSRNSRWGRKLRWWAPAPAKWLSEKAWRRLGELHAGVGGAQGSSAGDSEAWEGLLRGEVLRRSWGRAARGVELRRGAITAFIGPEVVRACEWVLRAHGGARARIGCEGGGLVNHWRVEDDTGGWLARLPAHVGGLAAIGHAR